MNISIKKALLIVGGVLFSLGLGISLIFNVILSPSIEYPCGIPVNQPYGIWGENESLIDSTIYIPRPQYDIYEDKPAIILVHGHPFDKSHLKGVAFELNKRGFLAVCISARGSGASMGRFVSDVHFHNETLATIQWLRNNAAIFRIDINRIGLIGHSMGAVSVTNAAIIDHESSNFWINSTVSIGGPVLNYSNEIGCKLQSQLGIFNILYPYSSIAFNFFYPKNQYNIQDAMKESIIEGRTNNVTPYNYLNVIGSADTSFSIESSQEVVWHMGFQEVFNVSSFNELILNKRYGDFDGSARKLCVVPNVDHFGVIHNTQVLVEIINWFENSMKLKNETNILITESIRVWFVPLTILGLFILFIPISIYIVNYLKISDKSTKNDSFSFEKQNFSSIFKYGTPFFLLGVIVFPLISFFDLQSIIFTGNQLFNLIILFIFVHSLIFMPFLFLLMNFDRKNSNVNHLKYNFSNQNNVKSIFYGLILFLMLFIPLNLIISNNYFNFFPWRIFNFLITLLYVFVFVFINEFLYRGIIQIVFIRFQGKKLWKIPDKEFIYSTIVSGSFQGITFGIIFSSFLYYINMNFDVIIAVFFLYIIASFIINAVQTWLFKRCRNILGTSVFLSLFLTWIFNVFLPYI